MSQLRQFHGTHWVDKKDSMKRREEGEKRKRSFLRLHERYVNRIKLVVTVNMKKKKRGTRQPIEWKDILLHTCEERASSEWNYYESSRQSLCKKKEKREERMRKIGNHLIECKWSPQRQSEWHEGHCYGLAPGNERSLPGSHVKSRLRWWWPRCHWKDWLFSSVVVVPSLARHCRSAVTTRRRLMMTRDVLLPSSASFKMQSVSSHQVSSPFCFPLLSFSLSVLSH